MNRKKCFSVSVAIAVSVFFVPPVEAANVVFVGDIDDDGGGDGNDPVYAAADASMVNHMSNVLGHTVSQIDDEEITADAVAGADFIVVSATSYSGSVASGKDYMLATDATIVHMESGNSVVQAFELAGQTWGTTIHTTIEIVALDGYITNSFSLGPLTIYNFDAEIRGWGVTPPIGTNLGLPEVDYTGDVLLATVPDDPFQSVVMGTHTIGDNTIVALPFGNGGFDQLTAAGLQLFNNVFAPPGPQFRADFDADGDVDGDDFLTWQAGFGVDDRGDTDDDGDTDGDDFLVWQAEFGSAGGDGHSSAVVPEPASLLQFAMAVFACLALMSCRGPRPPQH